MTGLNLNAQVGDITGPTLVCSSSAQYSISVPSGCTVVWDASGIVQESSPPYSNPATFSITGNGSGNIVAVVYNNMDVIIGGDDLDIWAGPPDPPDFVTSETYTYGYVDNWYSFTISPYNSNQESQAVDNIYGADDSYDYGQNYWSLYFAYEGPYQIWATNSNTCGESDAVYMYYLGPEQGIEFGWSVYE